MFSSSWLPACIGNRIINNVLKSSVTGVWVGLHPSKGGKRRWVSLHTKKAGAFARANALAFFVCRQ